MPSARSIVLVGLLTLGVSSGSSSAPKDAALAAKATKLVVPMLSSSVRTLVSTTSPTDCSANCMVEVWVYAPNEFLDPDSGAREPKCAAVVQSNQIVVSNRGHTIKWQLVKKTAGDAKRYEFDADPTGARESMPERDGIDVKSWTKPRYRASVRDLTDPTRSTTVSGNDTFSWTVANTRKRDPATCHDPSNTDERPGVAGKKCEMAYVAKVLDIDLGTYCAAYDPTIINTGN